MRTFRLLAVACLAWPSVLACPAAVYAEGARQAPPAKRVPSAEELDFFERKIRPVLAEKCYSCHSQEQGASEGGLVMDSRDGMAQGGNSGPAVVPGGLEHSLILDAIKHEGLEMPPDEKLSAEVIKDFERWIAMGAPDPRVATAPLPKAAVIDFAAARQFWSFQQPTRHVPPPTSQPKWIRQPIDAFILARLEQEGFATAEPADAATLIRRVTFDLTGLPPAPEAVAGFVADAAPSAYERYVEGLLASPRFGERWARPWLDLARYGEDQAHIVGDDRSQDYPNAHRYRDWVIAALNADLPYDRFVALQLAADLLEPDATENRPALGFIGLGPKYYSRKKLEVMADEWEDRVDVVSRGLLGLTVACARCHDHKYDPIEAEDYHALAGVFASTRMFNEPLAGREDVADLAEDGQTKDPQHALHVVREGTTRDLPVFIRGDVNSPGPIVPRRFLTVLAAGEPEPFREGSGRMELARAIASASNPLTARVIVNRVWGQLFGRPLVATASNFGALGERPSHPELLDDLAVRFMEQGWSLKAVIRELVLSATYRQASWASPATVAADPANVLLARMSRKRLPIEMWRDAMLVVGGDLDPTVGGESAAADDPAATRRTIYSRVSRRELNPVLALFDFPNPNVHADRRMETATPLQKLFVMNNPFMVARAERLAERVRTAAPAGDPERIALAHALLFGRAPDSQERDLATDFLAAAGGGGDAWARYAHVLLSSNEFMMLD